MWAGQVASRQSDPVLALDYAERVLADKRAKPYEIASAATLVLSLTSPYSQPYAEAWKQIEDVARDPKNPASLGALVLLANEQAVPPMPAIGGNTSLSLESPRHHRRLRQSRLRRATGHCGSAVCSRRRLHAGLLRSSQPTPATQSGDTVTLIWLPLRRQLQPDGR